MNRLNRLGIYLIMLVLIGCASVDVSPPNNYDRERNRVYSVDYETTWSRAVDWFANHNVTIEKIEKTSGLLTAKYRLQADETLLDCGNIETQGTMNDPKIDRSGSLNVTVREHSDNRTAVNVNFFGDFQLVARDAWDGSAISTSGDCVSTGELERRILNFISDT